MFGVLVASLVAVLGAKAQAVAAPLPFDAKPWAIQVKPAAGAPKAIGDYSRGCVQGAVVLPEHGPGYQVMRPARRRNFGHPALVAFVQRLAKSLRKQKLGPLMVGDLAQPRGGPALSGHASHQTGLDVDLWYAHPPEAKQRRLTSDERNQSELLPVVDLGNRTLNKRWQPSMTKTLRLAARDPAVDRIFVHARIKKTLCESAGEDKAWLTKLRPWWGHHDHFHVRLRCPSNNAECQSQRPLDGDPECDAKLDWWFSEAASATQARRRAEDQATKAERSLPEGCRAVLQAR